jgi:hypothetical protein
MTARTGQPDIQNRTAMTGLPGQEPAQNCQHRADSTGLPAQDSKDQTTRAEQKGEDSQKRQACKTARTGQPEQGSQNCPSKTRL